MRPLIFIILAFLSSKAFAEFSQIICEIPNKNSETCPYSVQTMFRFDKELLNTPVWRTISGSTDYCSQDANKIFKKGHDKVYTHHMKVTAKTVVFTDDYQSYLIMDRKTLRAGFSQSSDASLAQEALTYKCVIK